MDLVEQHPQRYSAHVEPVKEVLDVHVGLVVHLVRVLQLEDALGHGLNHIVVAMLNCF